MSQAEFKTVEHALVFMRDKAEGHAKAKDALFWMRAGSIENQPKRVGAIPT